MCGIAAALGAVDTAAASAVHRATRAQAHRGPDGEGLFRDDRVALGHRRLSILDVSARGRQPMRDEETGAVLSYNGEVYNFGDLRKELETDGAPFRSQTDTEVVLRAWRAWGPACVDRFRGIFAFALWDPERRALFLARDRLGVKPLYYTTVERPDGPLLLVASELRGLLATGLVPPELDPEILATYVWQGFVQGPRAIVRGVRCLAAGHRALVPADRPAVHEEPFWRLPGGGGEMESEEALARQLEEAVAHRLVSDVPLGVFLSGGIDSSAVAALAARASAGDLRTFNVGFEESAYDETRFARSVSEAIGSEHQTVLLTRGTFSDALPVALESLDQPSFDQLNTYFVSRAVREAGLTVALSGLGGDELFGGYASFVDLPRAMRVARAVPAFARAAASGLLSLSRGWPGPQERWAKLPDVVASGGDPVALYQVCYALFTRRFHEALLHASATSPLHGLVPERQALLAETVAGATPLQAISLLELACFAGERLLRDSDAASMAVGLELRVPLLDHRVVEEAFRLDDRVRFHPLGRKRILRDVALREVEPALFERPKAGFVLPIDVWARETLRSEVGKTLLERERCAAVGLDADAVEALWRAFDSGARGIHWSRIWALYALLWWCERHGAAIA